MAPVQSIPWIDQLADWISVDNPSQSKEELANLCRDLEIAVAMADSLVECSEELQRIAQKWTVQHGKHETNC